ETLILTVHRGGLMSARAFFFTTIRDDSTGAAYERWAQDVDYPFTRPQPSVGRYEIMRVSPLAIGTAPAWEYVELIEVDDADTFPSVFEQPEAEPIIKELRTFINTDPLGLVGRQVYVEPGKAARTSRRAVFAVRIASETQHSAYEGHATALAHELVASPGIGRVEIVRIDGRYKRDDDAPLDYLVIVDVDDSHVPPNRVEELLEPVLVNSAESFALGGTLIECLDRPVL
ncbi:MAG: hypothetical protein ACR2OD_02120, partial [Gaiellaceae bacterium]